MNAKKNRRTVGCRESEAGKKSGSAPVIFHPRPSTLDPRLAFTLIELLTVISIIGILAALLFPAFSAVKRHALINHASVEMAQLETAIESYKAAYGFYPPDNPNATSANLAPALTNQLYYELEGTTLTNGNFETLDGSSQIASSGPNDVSSFFGVDGFINCNSTNITSEDHPVARDFLPDLKPGQIATNSAGVAVIVTSDNGPDANYQPLSGFTSLSDSPANPWRYLYPGVNNPGAYDLWVQLVIGGKTNLVCNWSKQVQINSPLP